MKNWSKEVILKLLMYASYSLGLPAFRSVRDNKIVLLEVQNFRISFFPHILLFIHIFNPIFLN